MEVTRRAVTALPLCDHQVDANAVAISRNTQDASITRHIRARHLPNPGTDLNSIILIAII